MARLGLALTLLLPVAARAAEIQVVTSGTFRAAFAQLIPEFERASGDTVAAAFGPSMGTTHDAIPVRLERGEAIDVVIMAAPALADLIGQGKIRADSRVVLVRSRIGMAVRAGAARPDIRTVDALRRTLLAARSIGVSDSASGVYLSGELFPRLGIAAQIAAKVRTIEADPVGERVANGEVEIGFQQVSELRPVQGIEIAGELPEEVQRVTVFAAGIPSTARQREAARRLIRWLASPAAFATIRASGLEPAASTR